MIQERDKNNSEKSENNPNPIRIQKLVEGGQGMGYSDKPAFAGKTFFVWNALPDEEIEVEILNKRKGVYEAKAVNILKPSKHRVTPTEDHFLSCSPWAMMNFDYENEMKAKISTENFKRIGGIDFNPVGATLELSLQTDGNQFGYRNKMEFSFTEKDGKISLALFNRGQKSKVALEKCELASSAINETAKNILEWINSNKLTIRNLKTLIVRSNQKGEMIAGLFIKDKLDLNCRGLIHQTQKDERNPLIGFSLYYSTHKSPASVITEVLCQEGQNYLTEEINLPDVQHPIIRLQYGLNSFFQVNIPVFEMALKDIIKEILDNSHSKTIRDNSHLVDFYSGVGTIGLCIAASVETQGLASLQLIESNEEAVSFANKNIALNNIVGAHCHAPIPAEKTLDAIQKDSILIFDPPRAGLHQKVIERILETKPPKIIYLSCNTATQARDIGLLNESYNIKLIKLYNFFPRTPHIESLCILEVK